MKIDTAQDARGLRSGDGPGRGSRRRSRRAGSGDTDIVTISDEARRMVEESAPGRDASGDERAARIAALKAQVASGEYEPDLRRTALILVHDNCDHLV